MTAIPTPNAAAKMASTITEPVIILPQPSASQIGRGQFATIDPSTGFASLNDGTVGFRLPAGVGYNNVLSDIDPTAGRAFAALFCGATTGLPQSTVTNDGFTAASIAVPFYIANENTPGALPVLAGVDRSVGGLVMGMEPGSTTIPRLLTGPLAGLMALLVLHLKSAVAGLVSYAADALAVTDIGSPANPVMVPRSGLRGKLAAIRLIPSASLAATTVNNSTITFVKVDTTGVVALAASPVVGTFTTTTALVAGQPALFTLSGVPANLLFRSTDILGYYRTHASNGAIIPQSAIVPDFQVV